MRPGNSGGARPGSGAPKGNSNARKHGLNTLRTALTQLGSRAIDGRSSLSYALKKWRRELIEDLGGEDNISTQQSALIDLAVKSKLILDSIDAWVLTQPTLINARKRTLIPVVLQRQQLADGLARYLIQLGLERRHKVKTLHDLLNSEDEAETHDKAELRPMTSTDPVSCVSQSLTTSNRHSGRCQNPFCLVSIEPLEDGWRRTERRYCSNPCRMDGYVLRRAKAMLAEVGIVQFHKLLDRA
jgi:hypothetical protein